MLNSSPNHHDLIGTLCLVEKGTKKLPIKTINTLKSSARAPYPFLLHHESVHGSEISTPLQPVS